MKQLSATEIIRAVHNNAPRAIVILEGGEYTATLRWGKYRIYRGYKQYSTALSINTFRGQLDMIIKQETQAAPMPPMISWS